MNAVEATSNLNNSKAAITSRYQVTLMMEQSMESKINRYKQMRYYFASQASTVDTDTEVRETSLTSWQSASTL